MSFICTLIHMRNLLGFQRSRRQRVQQVRIFLFYLTIWHPSVWLSIFSKWVLFRIVCRSYAWLTIDDKFVTIPEKFFIHTFDNKTLSSVPLFKFQAQPICFALIIAQNQVVKLGSVRCVQFHALVDCWCLTASHRDHSLPSSSCNRYTP